MAVPARSGSSCTRARPFGEEGPRTVHVGPPVTLPAEPGTYTFPAPHVFADYRSITYGIEQETGGHAIMAQIRCEPEDGEGDFCSSQSVDVYRPPLGGAIPDRRTASDVHRGRELTIEPIRESDADGDGAGDQSEDRTNLRASATTRRLSGHRRAFDITVENAGPRTADRPQVQARLVPSPGLGAWTPGAAESSASSTRARRTTTHGTSTAGWRHWPSASGEPCGSSSRTWGSAMRSSRCPPRAATWRAAMSPRAPRSVVRGRRCRWRCPPARNRSSGIHATVRSTRKGRVGLQVRRGSRTYTRTITFRRAGKRDVTLRPPQLLTRENGVVTITARSGNATVRARLLSSY